MIAEGLQKFNYESTRIAESVTCAHRSGGEHNPGLVWPGSYPVLLCTHHSSRQCIQSTGNNQILHLKMSSCQKHSLGVNGRVGSLSHCDSVSVGLLLRLCPSIPLFCLSLAHSRSGPAPFGAQAGNWCDIRNRGLVASWRRGQKSLSQLCHDCGHCSVKGDCTASCWVERT